MTQRILMSKIVKASASKKHNMPDFKVMGNVSTDIVRKINQLVAEKTQEDVVAVIDYINTFVKAKITNISVDTWDEAFQTDWKRSSNYTTPTCAMFLVARGSAELHVDKDVYGMTTGQLCFVNEWCTHKLVNTSSAPLTMLLAQFPWDTEVHGK